MLWFNHSGLLLAVQSPDVMPEGSILHFDKSLLIKLGIQWVNILILTVVLVLLLYKPVQKFMRDRAERIKNDIDDARSEMEKAEELKEKYELMIANIEKEREELLHQAHRKAMEKSDHLLLVARQEADAIFHQKMAELELERKNISDEMKRQMIEISLLMASRFVEISIDRETQDEYIDKALTDWGENPW